MGTKWKDSRPPSPGLFTLLASLSASREPPGEKTPRKGTWFPLGQVLLQGSPLAFTQPRALGPKRTKSLPKPRTQNASFSPLTDVLMAAQSQVLVSLQSGLPQSGCRVPYF